MRRQLPSQFQLSRTFQGPRARPTAAAAAAIVAAAPAQAFTVFGPTPYLSEADIPAGFYAGGAPLLLEKLESGPLHPSLAASTGRIIGAADFGSLVDSVDADDGVIDGLGNAGRSWFELAGSTGVTFTYVGAGPLPTAFGIVWTDGGGDITLRATSDSGLTIVERTFSGFPDGSFSGTTAEDRFMGVTFEGGIRSIFVSNSGGGIELDHIQYGAMVPIPEPGSWALMLLGMAGVAWRAGRARAGTAAAG